MFRSLTFALLATLLFTPRLIAQWVSVGNVGSLVRRANGIELRTGSSVASISAIGDLGFRVRVVPGNLLPEKDDSWALDPKFSVTPVEVQLEESPQYVSLKIPSGRAVIFRSPMRIAFYDAQNNLLSEDAEPMAFTGRGFRVTKRLPVGERYYGLGDKTTLVLNDRAFTLWNTDAYGWEESTDPLYKAIPFFVAMNEGRGYGIFMDNPWRSFFDFGKERHDAYSFGAEGGELNYYFYFGPAPRRVLSSYMQMTGRPPLPPLWTLGYQQSRYSYYPESQVRELVSTFRRHQIPLDAIYLDIDYQQDNRPFTVNRERFPDFAGMVQALREQGVSTIVINDLHIAKADYPPYESGTKQDVFIHNADGTPFVGVVWPGPAVFPDFTLSRVREWWGGLYADFVKAGVRGIWNDMNEPSVFQVPSKTMPLDTVHRLDDGGAMPHLGAHNILGEQNSRATYDGLVRLLAAKDERPFVLTRATYAGGQRFSATWTGDNSGTWNHMRMSVPTLLNLGISGFALAGDDVGGFRGTAPPDLVTRWMWLGAFNPIFRNHSEKGSGNKEPWAFGPEYEAMMKAAIEQRYRMLPYIYSAAEESARTGVPMMRPLFLDFPQDTWLAGNEQEFMFGPAMLVAPKVWEFNEPYSVALPGGTWYDYWTGKTYVSEVKKSGSFTAAPTTEGLSVEVKPAVNEIPVFVKGGSIVAHQPVVQSTQFLPQGNLELRVYPGAGCAGSLYMDDGHSLNVGNKYLRVEMSCAQSGNSATLKLEKQQGAFKPWFKSVDVVLYGAPHAAQSAAVNGKTVGGLAFDEARHAARVTVPYQSGGETITLTY